jgi:hypothetical protein
MLNGSPTSVYLDAIGLLNRLPARGWAPSTETLYASNFIRMWREPTLDPLREPDARGTFGVRRAAMFWGARKLLKRLLTKFELASSTENKTFAIRLLRVIRRVVARVTEAIKRDPPLVHALADFSQPSRWTAESTNKLNGQGSKRHTLSAFPSEWRELVWAAVRDDSEYRIAIAVLSLSPCRPSELVPGVRPSGFSEGVVVTLTNDILDITHAPTKTHSGKYGSPSCGLAIDIAEGGETARYLADLCVSSGGRLVVSLDKIDGLRKYLERLGKKLFPDCPIISAYTFRTQRLADIKATFGEAAAESAASAGGHCNDDSQRHYGWAVHGRKGGILSVHTARKPQLISTLRVRNLRGELNSLVCSA